jgi:SAM-dependent methyltransferase
MVAQALGKHHPGGGVLLDVGCGECQLHPFVRERFATYAGADAVRYEGIPPGIDFYKVDLDTGRVPVPDGFADVVVAVEVIEHLENPRAFARELTRLVKPGGWIVMTTPNQLSFLSKLTLLLRNEFNAFRDGSYPAHLTALLEVDLRRIAAECGWTDVTIGYTRSGRIPGVSWHWPGWVTRLLPRSLSDNILVAGRKAEAPHP